MVAHRDVKPLEPQAGLNACTTQLQGLAADLAIPFLDNCVNTGLRVDLCRAVAKVDGIALDRLNTEEMAICTCNVSEREIRPVNDILRSNNQVSTVGCNRTLRLLGKIQNWVGGGKNLVESPGIGHALKLRRVKYKEGLIV